MSPLKEKIQEFRTQRLTYREIGDLLNISKQRVHQLYKNYGPTDHKARKKAIIRDVNRCRVCGYDKNLEVHHVNGSRNDNSLENLLTLCRKCHLKKESKLWSSIKPIAEKFFKPRVLLSYTCIQCKNIYSPREKRRKFCSFKCVREYKKSKRIMKKCFFCNKEFYRRQKRIKYCSLNCANNAMQVIYKSRPPKTLEEIKAKRKKEVIRVWKYHQEKMLDPIFAEKYREKLRLRYHKKKEELKRSMLTY